jgi:hypothetical protein
MEIRWKYNRNNPSRLGEIRDSIRISMVFHEAACRRQASQRKEMRFLVFARQNARTKMLDTSKFF